LTVLAGILLALTLATVRKVRLNAQVEKKMNKRMKLEVHVEATGKTGGLVKKIMRDADEADESDEAKRAKIGKEEKKMSIKHFRRRTLDIAGVLFVSAVFSAAFSGAGAAPARGEKRFAVIVDAGSSGSRIYVYQYDSGKEVPDLKQIQRNGKSWNYKKRPGISSLAGRLDDVKEYVNDLLQHLKDELPETSFPRSSWDSTPFMWFATAGMRLLPATEANDLTNKIREVANDKEVVPFHFMDSWARTLSGEEEGAFAWISLNYLNDYFTKDSVEDYGVVETGGASSQMTFLSTGNILSNKFNVIINRKLYPLYTHSFLYFGQDQIRKRIFHNECTCAHGDSNDCRTPCRGHKNAKVKSACLLKDYEKSETITEDDQTYEVTMIGTGDPAQCTTEMDYLFKADYTCFTRPCSFAGIYQPPFRTNRKFYGTSAIRYALKGLGMLEKKLTVTWPEIKDAADDYCKKSKDSLDPKDKYGWSRCLASLFVAKEFEHLQFAKDHSITIQDFDTWTVGAVLYQLELMEILFPDASSY